MSDFHSYAHSHLAYLQKHGQKVIYKKGQLLVRREEDSPWSFFIESGYVKMMFTDDIGNERVLGFGIPGMTITQSGSFYSMPHVELEYEAHTDCIVWRMPRSEFIAAMQQNPEIFREWHERILQNHNLLIERILYIGEKQPRRRIISWLLAMARYYSFHQPDDSYFIEIPVNQSIIASWTHLSRETTSKIISELKKQGLIHIKHRFITVPDIEKLRKALYA
ncbi:MAG TPA: Crp/Fnr family transcriptional regulator [Candidatus Saccharibacteria bacterium]|nr:Crp/Fnr family transcriptional regulator [Candidatus Saccharibacteria bacterium]HMR38730.1 Crp/Fnr family transcriptional regulator [Candidatus Saccharibacteria bacterium]